MKIIAHRGAGGAELENSLSSISAAFKLDVDAVEFDIHHTKDDVLVVMHDVTTGRTASEDVRIKDVTFKRLRAIQLHNGQQVPTLEEVLGQAGRQTIYIDIKDDGCAVPLLRLLRQFPKLRCVFVSAKTEELRTLRTLMPSAETYLYFRKRELVLPRPVKMVKMAQKIDATGIAIDKLLLNPAVYGLAKRAGLRMYTYSINTGRAARVIAKLYPEIDIATKHPEIINRHLKSELRAK